MRSLLGKEGEELLTAARIGRLGCVDDGEPYVVPISYFFEDGSVYSHSLPGRKIDILRAHPRACLQVDGHWRNSTFYFGPEGASWRYDKLNLARSERGDFTPGDALPVHEIQAGGELVRLGVQMCREIRYPEQWRWLATQGAQIIVFVNNAVGRCRAP